MAFWDDLIGGETLDAIRAKVIAACQQAKLDVTNWIQTSVAYQEFEAHTQIVYTYTQTANKLVRQFASLDTAVDPGDPDPFDANNATLPWKPAGLSNYGASTFGTTREGPDYGTGTVVFTNAGSGARTFSPGGLVFTWTGGSPPPQPPTYHNLDGGPTYTATPANLTVNPDNSLTVPVGYAVTVPVQADVIGTGSNAPPNVLSLTTTLLGCSVTSSSAVLASNLEPPDAYRARCRLAPASVSPNGPADAYRYIALSAQSDSAGNVFYFQTSNTTQALGVTSTGAVASFTNPQGTPLGITRVMVTTESTTGDVAVWCATLTGAPVPASGSMGSPTDAVKDLINGVYWPDATTRTFADATNVTVNVTATVEARAGAGVSIASVTANILGALANPVTGFPNIPIGGFDQVSNVGTLYVSTIARIIGAADPSIYFVNVTSPGSDVSMTAGPTVADVAVYTVGTIMVTVK